MLRMGHRRTVPGSLAVGVILATLAGCPIHEDDMGEAHPCPGPCLEIEPRHHDFGVVPAGHEVVRGWTLTAVGSEPVTIHDVRLEGSSTLSLDDELLDSPIAPGESAWVRVAFFPCSEEELSGTLRVDSDDPLEPAVAIPLVGLGVAPVIELTPELWDAGEPYVGCDQATSIQIRNAGSAPLTIEGLTLSSPSGEFFEEHPFVDGVVLPPLALQSVSVFYQPLDEEPDQATLIVHSDDPISWDVEVGLSGAGVFAGEVEDVFEVQGEARADLLFVVDNTETMEWYQVQLGQHTDVLVESLAVAGIDARVAVVTTDDAAFVGPVLDPAAPAFEDDFSAQVGVGLLGDPWERGLLFVRDALTPPMTDPGGPNDGLLRDSASLHVLVLSDADDHSLDDPLDYVDALVALKPSAGFVTVHGMTGQMAGCTSLYAAADPADRYETAIAGTGGASSSICVMDWDEWFETIHWLPPLAGGIFPLSEKPVAATLEVQVDGAPVTAGWSLDPWTPAVVFEPGETPLLGAQVVVRYVSQGEC